MNLISFPSSVALAPKVRVALIESLLDHLPSTSNAIATLCEHPKVPNKLKDRIAKEFFANLEGDIFPYASGMFAGGGNIFDESRLKFWLNWLENSKQTEVKRVFANKICKLLQSSKYSRAIYLLRGKSSSSMEPIFTKLEEFMKS